MKSEVTNTESDDVNLLGPVFQESLVRKVSTYCSRDPIRLDQTELEEFIGLIKQ